MTTLANPLTTYPKFKPEKIFKEQAAIAFQKVTKTYGVLKGNLLFMYLKAFELFVVIYRN